MVIATPVQDGDHRRVVAPRRGLDAMQHRVLDKEMVGQPLHRCRAIALAAMPTRNPKVEQWTSVFDITEVEQPDKSDDSAGVANPERTRFGVRDTDGLRLGDRKLSRTVKRPVTAEEERHERAGFSRTDTLERQPHRRSLTAPGRAQRRSSERYRSRRAVTVDPGSGVVLRRCSRVVVAKVASSASRAR